MSAHVNCCQCGIDFCMPNAHHRQLRESHATFFCPNGHRNYYAGKTPQEKKIESLERRLGWYEDDAKYQKERFKERTMQAVELLRACPVGCGWHSPCHIREAYNFDYGFPERVRWSVALHLAEVHGVDVAELVESEELARG